MPHPGPDATPASEHQQAGDDYASPSGEPISLPRRRHPVLVSDHGRPVESPRPGRDQRPAGQPGRPMEPVPDPEPTLTLQRPAQPPARPASPASAAGLPRRVRQASLAPQLKKEPAQAEPEPQPDDSDPQRDAEMARAKMASLQRGWQQHTTSAYSNGPAGTAPGTTWEGDGR